MAEEKKNEVKKKPDALGIVLRILVIIAAALFCVLAVLSWPSIREKGFYATFFGETEEGEIVRAEELEFVANQKNVFAAYRSGLAVLNPSGLTLLGADGEASLDISKSFNNPALYVDGDKLLAYDAGGTNMLYIDKGTLSSDAANRSSMVTASMNAKGWRVIIDAENGWKSVANVMDGKGEPMYSLRSAERYLTSAAISPDCTRIALGGVRQSNAEIISSVYIFELTGEEPIAFWETTDGVPTDVRFLGDGYILAVCDSMVAFIDGDTGQELGRYELGSRELAACAVGDGFVALAASSEGNGAWVLTFSFAGEELARQGFSSILDLSASGNVLGVLTSDSVLVYNNYLESSAVGDTPAGARRILLADESSAYILSSNTATLYEF